MIINAAWNLQGIGDGPQLNRFQSPTLRRGQIRRTAGVVDRHSGLVRRHDAPLRLPPPLLLQSPPMAGARRLDRLLSPGHAPRGSLARAQELLLLPRQLPHPTCGRARRVPALAPVLSPHPPLTPRRVDLPLPLPPLRSSRHRLRPHFLGSRDAMHTDRAHRGRDLPHPRRIAADVRSVDRIGDGVRSRGVSGSSGPVS
ncbi:prenylated RAB acceptor 1.B6 [Actinidia rufa]|uniref:Prenylated RAB acceptor 1.B6 n=1 Tax=Actinidia rufa TaxID=165716 RepID=A0A7J0HAD1_9ERIC|nr:prenylated RAB acceptor 1.B6 [Actinidia rufa]